MLLLPILKYIVCRECLVYCSLLRTNKHMFWVLNFQGCALGATCRHVRQNQSLVLPPHAFCRHLQICHALHGLLSSSSLAISDSRFDTRVTQRIFSKWPSCGVGAWHCRGLGSEKAGQRKRRDNTKANRRILTQGYKTASTTRNTIRIKLK